MTLVPPSFPSSPSDPPASAAEHLWAKFQDRPGDGKQESIPFHTDGVLAVYDRLRLRFEPLLNEGESFWRDLYVALLFHDAGKFVLNFQDENRKRANGKSPDWERYLRHEFVSCLLLVADYERLVASRPDAIFAVASHHKPLTKDLFKEGKTAVDNKQLDYRDSDLTIIENWLRDRLGKVELPYELSPAVRESLMDARGGTLEDCRRLLFGKLYGDIRDRKGMLGRYKGLDSTTKRLTFARFLGLLHACDWAGSGRRMPPPPLDYSERDMRRYMETKIPGFKNWRAFQQRSAEEHGHVLAIAPTGSGKTEAALLWAANRPVGGGLFTAYPPRLRPTPSFGGLRRSLPEATRNLRWPWSIPAQNFTA